MNNKLYHSDTSMLSSSMLKLLRKDPALFYRNYVEGDREQSEAGHFVEGTYTHALLLEPEKVEHDFAFFTGGIKRGHAWQNFADQNREKTIVSAPQKHRAEQFAATVNRRPEALRMLQGGFPEHTMTGAIMEVPVKMRADYINLDKGYIVDVKTTAQVSDPEIFKFTIQQYDYDLSAAHYCQVAHDATGKLFDFYWVVISKQDLVCDIYKASSDTLSRGMSKVIEALYLYKKCSETGIWKKEHKQNFDSNDYEILEV